MKKVMRAAAAGLLFAGLATAGVAGPTESASASTVCGTSQVRGPVYWIVSGYTVYNITHIYVHYRNCYPTTLHKKVDISFAPDLYCQTVQPYSEVSWDYPDNSSDFSSIRGVVDC